VRRNEWRRDEQQRQHDAVQPGEEPEDGAGETLPIPITLAVVEQPHERRVEPAAEHDLRDDFDGQQQADRAVVRRRQKARVERQQQEADDVGGDITKAVNREIPAERGQTGEHRA
jgi:hypothetical protein